MTNAFLVLGITGTAAVFDLRSYRVPQTLTLLGYLAGLLSNLMICGPGGILTFIYKALWPIILLYFIYLMKGLGAGDIKLFSVISTFVTTEHLIYIFICSVLFGAIYSIYLICKKKKKMQFAVMIYAASVVDILFNY